MTPEQIDLLPCPFCRGEAKIRISWLSRSKVECIDCGASTVWLGQIADCPTPPWIRISSAWNRRASPVNTALAEDAARAHDLALEVERLRDLIEWAYETLSEINPSNYDHDDVCRLNDNSVEVILGLKPTAFAASSATPRDTHAATAAVLSARDSTPGDQE